MTADPSIIFYSWQSDLPNATNRSFIERALKDAARSIRDDDSLQVEPVVDRDTEGVAGSPEISSTIFAKIDRAQVVVCDVSLINRDSAGRKTPNPNVLIELGYALRSLGPERIVMVLNDAFGEPELLPFDLRLRRITRYTTQTETSDRAPERRRLEQSLATALRTIFENAGSVAPNQPLSLGEQVRLAIEAGRPDQVAMARQYMAEVAARIEALNPHFAEVEQAQWDDLLLEAIGRSRELALEFANLAGTAAALNATEVFRALHGGFGRILEMYITPRGFSGTYRKIDFDFPKFIGHELFVTLFASLIRESRWELIAELLDEDLYVRNAAGGRPGMLKFEEVSDYVALLTHRNQRLGLRKISLHADILNQRHTEGPLAEIVPMHEFTEADYFLFLRAHLAPLQPGPGIGWRPWSTLYLRDPPSYLVAATRRATAERIAHSVGLESVELLRERLAERASRLEGMFSAGFWDHPLRGFDVNAIGSR